MLRVEGEPEPLGNGDVGSLGRQGFGVEPVELRPDGRPGGMDDGEVVEREERRVPVFPADAISVRPLFHGRDAPFPAG